MICLVSFVSKMAKSLRSFPRVFFGFPACFNLLSIMGLLDFFGQNTIFIPSNSFCSILELQFKIIRTFLIRTLLFLMVLSRTVATSILRLLRLDHPLLRFPVLLKRSSWSNQVLWTCEQTRQEYGLDIFSDCPLDVLF